MAFLQFSNKQYIKSIDTAEVPNLGSFSLANNGELAHIRVLLYIKGVTSLSGNEQLRLKVYSDSKFNSLLYTSDWSKISDIPNLGTTNWIGFFRTDFNRGNLNKSLTYYVKVELFDYTRDAENFWIGLSHDFPFGVYASGETLFYETPLSMQIFTYS